MGLINIQIDASERKLLIYQDQRIYIGMNSRIFFESSTPSGKLNGREVLILRFRRITREIIYHSMANARSDGYAREKLLS